MADTDETEGKVRTKLETKKNKTADQTGGQSSHCIFDLDLSKLNDIDLHLSTGINSESKRSTSRIRKNKLAKMQEESECSSSRQSQNSNEEEEFKEIASGMNPRKEESINQLIAKRFVSAKIDKERIYDKILSEQDTHLTAEKRNSIRQVIYSNRKFHQLGAKKMNLADFGKLRSQDRQPLQKQFTIIDIEHLDEENADDCE
uniref:Uncharacterized protein n=1 Tax=Euplotes harpa TaxID=151035 RepID=A0A7S3N7P3_9SPIT|eukprot:CAMPEP_0168330386 /NCGR_PEP_ID=MMETSP0213-20121227/7699_1 /TAXON_ID=151035 /ORGANISM="Euplotes harpa, Strain FSP1.4" /LENGTH=201 /DNA_ID=CAMNT_0008333945 /DNA_START=70 /DNA_END=675 /DNA_ORIENTATION=+